MASATRASEPADTCDPSVLLVRPDHLGDVVLTLPAIMYLRRLLPSARVTYVVGSDLVDVPARCPAVDHCIGLPFPDVRSQEAPQRLPSSRATRLARTRHDVALLLRPNDPVGGELVSNLRIPARIGFSQPGTQRFVTHAVGEPGGHHAALGYRLVDALLSELGRPRTGPDPPVTWEEVVRDVKDMDMLVERPEDEREVEDMLSAVQQLAGRRPIVIHPGTGWPLKNWPVQRWAALARAISGRYGKAVLVTGAPADKGLCDGVVRAAGGCALSVAWRLSLAGFAALLRRASVVVAVDSGPLHLASIVGSFVVGLYGLVAPDADGPPSPASRRRLLGVDLPCRPCDRMTDPPCGAYQDPACITGVEVADVLDAVDDCVEAA